MAALPSESMPDPRTFGPPLSEDRLDPLYLNLGLDHLLDTTFWLQKRVAKRLRPLLFPILSRHINILRSSPSWFGRIEEISSDHRSEFSPGRGAGSAAPPRRTRPLWQGHTQDELKAPKSKPDLRREKSQGVRVGYLVLPSDTFQRLSMRSRNLVESRLNLTLR
jgi:hypothetical protein